MIKVRGFRIRDDQICHSNSRFSGSDIYNTLGLCNDKCVGKYAYAVLQYQECWCSNEKPSDTVSLESCDQQCPGYPDQNCGSKDAGLFGYVPLEGGDSASSAAATVSLSILGEQRMFRHSSSVY